MFYDKFVLADGSVLYDNIVSVSWTEQVNSDSDNITPGAVCANAIDIEFWLPADGTLAIAQGSTLTYYKINDDTGEETQIGIYTCEKPEKDGGNKYKVTAYDNITKLDIDVADWLNSLSFPVTISSFATQLATKCGLEFANTAPINGDYSVKAFTANSSTGRDLMKMAAQATGCFIRANATGKLEYAWYVTNSELRIAPYKSLGQSAFLYDIVPRQLDDNVPRQLTTSEGYHKLANDKERKALNDRRVVRLRTADVVWQPESTPYFSNQLTFSDFTITAIDKVQVKQSDDDVGVIYPADATGTNALVISANKLLVTDSDETLRPYVKNLYDRLNNMVYVPCSNIQTPETIQIRAGDIVTVTDGKREFVTWITSVKHSGNKCTFESVGSINRSTTTAVNSASYSTARKMLEISTSIDGLTVKASKVEKKTDDLSSDLADATTSMTEQYTELKQTFDSFSVIAVTDDNVRSKFALDSTSVTIQSGAITFKGNTLVVNSDNFKLTESGTVSITGSFTSSGSRGNARINNGIITLDALNADGNYYNTVYVGRTSSQYPSGALIVYSRRTDGTVGAGVYMHGSDADSSIWMFDASGNEGVHLATGTAGYSNFTGGISVKGTYGVQVSYGVSCQTLSAWQSKSGIAKTSFGNLEIGALECPEPMYADVGSGVCDKNGLCYIYADPRFAESVSQYKCSRWVVTPVDSNGNLWVEKIDSLNAVVHGKKFQKFDWMCLTPKANGTTEYATVTDSQEPKDSDATKNLLDDVVSDINEKNGDMYDMLSDFEDI